MRLFVSSGILGLSIYRVLERRYDNRLNDFTQRNARFFLLIVKLRLFMSKSPEIFPGLLKAEAVQLKRAEKIQTGASFVVFCLQSVASPAS